MNAIEINQLTWQYSNTSRAALEDISLSIEENQFIGICGPNESGKTTLVSCIKGLIPSNYNGTFTGEVKLFGKNIVDYNARELASTVGYVFADPEAQFTAMTVEEELAFGLENLGLSIAEIEERIQWVSRITMIEDLLDKSPYDISGGQKQRVAISSILAMRPRIMILDEPTSMLDPIGKDSVFEICYKMKEELNMTIIMVEHTIDRLARLSDQLILIHNGKIKKYDTPGNFFSNTDEIIEYGMNPPASILFLDKLKKAGLYHGEMKTSVEEVITIARELAEKRKVGKVI